jgi:hypothetical protein
VLFQDLRIERPIALTRNNLLPLVGEQEIQICVGQCCAAVLFDIGVDPSNGGLGENADMRIDDFKLSLRFLRLAQSLVFPSEMNVTFLLDGKRNTRRPRCRIEKWRMGVKLFQISSRFPLGAAARDDSSPGSSSYLSSLSLWTATC